MLKVTRLLVVASLILSAGCATRQSSHHAPDRRPTGDEPIDQAEDLPNTRHELEDSGEPVPRRPFQVEKVPTVHSLKSGSPVRIGQIGGDAVLVTLDAIADENYLKFTDGQPAAVVISHFRDEFDPGHYDPNENGVGLITNLGDAMLTRIGKYAPGQEENLLEVLGSRDADHGRALRFDLDPGEAVLEGLNLSSCYVVFFYTGSDGMEKLEVVSAALSEILKDANARGIKHLIIPPLTVKHHYRMNDGGVEYTREDFILRVFFSLILEEVRRAPAAPDIYIGLYSGWSPAFLDHAVHELMSALERYHHD